MSGRDPLRPLPSHISIWTPPHAPQSSHCHARRIPAQAGFRAHTPPLDPPCCPCLPAQGFLDGIGAELQASEAQELEEGEMRERVHQALTRK